MSESIAQYQAASSHIMNSKLSKTDSDAFNKKINELN